MITCLTLVLSAKEPDNHPLKEGHSHNGHAFNEGPRQSGTILGNTGNVHLPITCQWPEGQAYFDQGLGQLHGFWYYEAERSFRTILAHDPKCLMAYWGLAQANFENEKRAQKFAQKASELLQKEALKLSKHEKAYLQSEIDYYDPKKQKDAQKRRKALLRAYEEIILEYPNDLEAKALLVCRRWQFSRKGVPITSHVGLDAILEQIFAIKPNHPAHHYAIHLWDYRKHEQALDSAALLRKTAPDIAHMWHMPGHIYSKAKRYQDAIWHQEASARIDHQHMKKWFLLPDQIHNYAHNNEWLAQNYFRVGKVRESIEMAKSLLSNPRHPKLNNDDSKSSSRYGRKALIDLLEKSELWNEAITIAESSWLGPHLKPESDLSRLRLKGVAFANLGQQVELREIIETIETFITQEKSKEQNALKKAQEKATKEKKKPEEITKIEKKAKAPFQKRIKKLKKVCEELEGYLAGLNGNFELAIKALGKRPSHHSPLLRQLAYGAHEKAAETARKIIEKEKKETVSLAQAIHTLYHAKHDDDLWKKGFKNLRQFSSDIELTSPVFARLAPIAKELNFPNDWRLPKQSPSEVPTEKPLDQLGPLHWSPPSAPTFFLPDQTGKMISLESYRGKPMILIFYLGAGCLHCTEQLTAMADRYEDFKKAGFPILAISTDDVANLKKSQENYTKGIIPFPIVSDAPKTFFKKYTAHDDFEDQPLHGTFILNDHGKILWSDVSADPFMEIDFLIKEGKRLLSLHSKQEK